MWVGTAEFKEMASKASNANAPAKPAPKSKKRPRAPVDSSDEEADDADDDEVDSIDDEAASDGEESGATCVHLMQCRCNSLAGSAGVGRAERREARRSAKQQLSRW